MRATGRWRYALLALAMLVLLGFAFRAPLLSAAASFLHVGEEPVPADVMIVLGGQISARPQLAAELYARGLAPTILLVRVRDTPANLAGVLPNETDATAHLLGLLGVPDDAIVLLEPAGGAESTTDEAIAVRDYVELHPVERVLVVTTHYHTRRARWNMRRQLRDTSVRLQVVGAEDQRFGARDWWRDEEGMLVYLQEYLKFLHNRLYR